MVSTVKHRPLWRRVCRVLADEGVAGVGRRLRPRSDHTEMIAAAKREYERRLEDFKAASARLGFGDLSRYYWYHTIDLGRGVVTPGDYDYRSLLAAYGFPSDMRGMKVLDVGSATGFFAFEFEKRGADVVSLDLPSIADWDMPHSDREWILRDLMQSHGVSTLEELHHFHIEGPFQLCRKVLGSKVVRLHSRIYDLSAEKHGSFDMIFAGDVLLHTFSPLAALVALAPLCRGTLVIANELGDSQFEMPYLTYAGGEWDNRTWWYPNQLCLEQMLKRIGFKDVKLVGAHDPYPGRGGTWMTVGHTVFHATK
jgi:SAM-dependent methyltransferase